MSHDLSIEITKAYEAFDGLRTKEMLKDEKKFPEKNDILQMLLQSRQNYIRYFSFKSDYPLKGSITDEDILIMHSSSKVFAKNNFPDSNYLNYIKNKIIDAYMLPDKFASAIQNFFISSKDSERKQVAIFNHKTQYEYINKDKIAVFANVIIPSIYGFFIEESQASFGFDFICFLFRFEYDFYKPFFLSYLMSATTFLDIFWANFFIKINAERYSPSLFQLKEIFWYSLKSSIPFFSTYHIQLLKNCLLRDYTEFFDLLITSFIFPSFPIYKQFLLISNQKIDLLLEYIKKDDAFSSNIQKYFHQYNFVDSQKAQFLNDEIFVILSQYEAKLLFDLFQQFDESSKTQSPKAINPIFSPDINQFSPCYFEVHIDNKFLTDPFKRGPAPHIINTFLSKGDVNDQKDIISEPKISNDVRITYALLKIDCEENRINPLSVISNTEEISPDDTFEIKQLKNKYKDYENLHSLETQSLYLMSEHLDKQQKEFFTFLLQKQRINYTEDIKYRIKKRFDLLEEQFYSHFDSKSQNHLVTIRSIKYIPAVVEAYFDYRPSFVQLILSSFNSFKFNEFVLKNKNSLQKVAMNVSIMDSVDIYDRLTILENNLASVNSICEDDEELVYPIFLKCFNSGALRVLYETFIFTTLYKKDNSSNFNALKYQIPRVDFLFNFIFNQLEIHIENNPDDENIKKIIEGLTHK